MTALFYLLFAVAIVVSRHIPSGSELHIRLTSAVGSYASQPDDSVEAVLIAPLVEDGDTVIPAGSHVFGKVKSVKRVGLGIKRETAAIELDFNTLVLPDKQIIPFSAQVAQVDNGRERVTRDGVIRGVRTTSSLCYRASGYIRTALQWEFHAELAEWFIKTLLVQVPEPEIYYEPGVELTLRLTAPITVDETGLEQETTPRMTTMERVNLEPFADELPGRAKDAANRPSDLINVLFIGSRKQISTAFTAAGWAQPYKPTMRSRIHYIRAVAEGSGSSDGPMSSLFVEGSAADMAWQKGLNDVSKRDHIRIWKRPETWHGKSLWIGAATRDVDFAYFRPGNPLTHRVQKDIDRERDKIVDDLAFAGCVDSVDWIDRSNVPSFTRNATGDYISTDTKLAVVRLNDCAVPRAWMEPSDRGPQLAAHGGLMERFVRREILSMRSDLIRTNLYYRVYEGTRWLITAAVHHYRQRKTDAVPVSPEGLDRAQRHDNRPARGYAAATFPAAKAIAF